MKKLLCLLLALLCCTALATTVYADVLAGPFDGNPIGWILLIVVLPMLVFVLYAFLQNRKK